MGNPDTAELRMADERRLEFLEAVDVAIARRSEVLQICYEAKTPESAVVAVAALLDLPAVLAQAVTDMQFRRLTVSGREALDSERLAIRQRLA